MVAQQTRSKTSSARKNAKGTYAFRSLIKLDWQLPIEPELDSDIQQNLAGGIAEYLLLAKPGEFTADSARWKTPPHRAFVNLPVSTTPELGMEIVDPKALLGFSRRYGFLEHRTVRDRWVLKVESSASLERISAETARYGPVEFRELLGMKSQAVLKYAWKTGDRQAIDEIASAAKLQSGIDIATGAVVSHVPDAWTLICLLFGRDHAAGRTAICANPDCPAPYFLKSRKTQKFCEAGECVAWAQSNYALKWWRENESKAAKAKQKGEAK